MPNVIAFTPRPRPPEPAAPAPALAGLALREHLEGAAQTALDAADKIIAALDRLDGSDAPQEIEAAPEPRPAAPLAQIVRLGDLGDFRTAIPHTRATREEAPVTPSPEPAAETIAARTVLDDAESFATGIARPRLREEAAATEIRVPFPPLPWGGAGNVVAAAGCAVLALMGMRA